MSYSFTSFLLNDFYFNYLGYITKPSKLVIRLNYHHSSIENYCTLSTNIQLGWSYTVLIQWAKSTTHDFKCTCSDGLSNKLEKVHSVSHERSRMIFCVEILKSKSTELNVHPNQRLANNIVGWRNLMPSPVDIQTYMVIIFS